MSTAFSPWNLSSTRVVWCCTHSVLRTFAAQAPSPPPPTPPPPGKESYGGLKDEDRIFTNLYCQGDPFIKVSTRHALQLATLSWPRCQRHKSSTCGCMLHELVGITPWLYSTACKPRYERERECITCIQPPGTRMWSVMP